jgi:hypothetical protein
MNPSAQLLYTHKKKKKRSQRDSARGGATGRGGASGGRGLGRVESGEGGTHETAQASNTFAEGLSLRCERKEMPRAPRSLDPMGQNGIATS